MAKRRIYVASSWRNEQQPNMVNQLRSWGHQVYDFRRPTFEDRGFNWSQIDPTWKTWSIATYRSKLLNDPIAAQGFMRDMRGMLWADTCVLLQPCGSSAHLEMGLMCGLNKYTIVYLSGSEPELMYLMCNRLVMNMDELRNALDYDEPQYYAESIAPPVPPTAV